MLRLGRIMWVHWTISVLTAIKPMPYYSVWANQCLGHTYWKFMTVLQQTDSFTDSRNYRKCYAYTLTNLCWPSDKDDILSKTMDVISPNISNNKSTKKAFRTRINPELIIAYISRARELLSVSNSALAAPINFCVCCWGFLIHNIFCYYFSLFPGHSSRSNKPTQWGREHCEEPGCGWSPQPWTL